LEAAAPAASLVEMTMPMTMESTGSGRVASLLLCYMFGGEMCEWMERRRDGVWVGENW
jgi:hypothetical protein